jgi:hypothetical protein
MGLGSGWEATVCGDSIAVLLLLALGALIVSLIAPAFTGEPSTQDRYARGEISQEGELEQERLCED